MVSESTIGLFEVKRKGERDLVEEVDLSVSHSLIQTGKDGCLTKTLGT